MNKKFLIIGTSAAGISAAVKLRQLDELAEVICFSDEKEQPYNKCFLADYVAGEKSEEQIALRSKTFFEDKNIQIKLNTKIVKIDRDNKTINDQNDNSYVYDKLLLAMGG
jgi:NAD(P)H-nitrite reductase large subunit